MPHLAERVAQRTIERGFGKHLGLCVVAEFGQMVRKAVRFDPALKLACGRLPDTGRDLCSQPTVSRWENAPNTRATISPQPGPQTEFLRTPADICIYGGAAGGGKTVGLILEPLRYVSRVPGFTAVFFRRTTPQITNPGGLWDESVNFYRRFGGIPPEAQRGGPRGKMNKIELADGQRRRLPHVLNARGMGWTAATLPPNSVYVGRWTWPIRISSKWRNRFKVPRGATRDYIFGYGVVHIGRQGKREMATEHEGSAPEQPTTEPKEPAQIARMFQDFEKRMATLSDAIVEQSAERAQLSRVFLRWSGWISDWSEFVGYRPPGAAGFRRNPDIERYLSSGLAGPTGEASSGESTLVQGDVSATPSLDEINALLERLDHDIAAERVAMDDLLKRIREPRDSSLDDLLKRIQREPRDSSPGR
jgi:hypothetical protein